MSVARESERNVPSYEHIFQLILIFLTVQPEIKKKIQLIFFNNLFLPVTLLHVSAYS